MKINLARSLEALLQWGYSPHGNLQDAECLCAQAFSFRGPKDADELDRVPGPPNEEMGHIVRQLVGRGNLPFSIQGETAKSRAMAPIIAGQGDFTTDNQQVIFHNPAGGYVSCYTIETLTWEWMVAHGRTKVAIVTHPMLCWRMEQVMLRLAANDGLPIEVIVPKGLEAIGYDPWHGAQWRGWSEPQWWLHEMAARQHHVLKGWI